MYSREIDGQEYTFGVSGKLIRNVMVMYDHETNSLWSQLLGEAVEGPLKGTKLEFVASLQTTWSEWKILHPDTLALDKGYAGAFDTYASYYRDGRTGVIGETFQDDRLYVKEWVTGVALEGRARAYPWSELNLEPVVNDTLSDVPLLIVFDSNTASSIVFDRRNAGQTLTFSRSTGSSAADILLRDEETDSTWLAFEGRAIDGPLEGSQLNQLKSTSSFWFGWKDFYPETEVYSR